MNQKNNNFRKKTFGKPKFHGRRGPGGHSNNGGHSRDSRDKGGEGSGSFDIRSARKAEQMRDKYLQMAKEALSSGDRVLSENYHQHADHYFRIILEAEKNGVNLRAHNNSQNNGEEKSESAGNGNPVNAALPEAAVGTLGNAPATAATDAELQNVAFLRKNGQPSVDNGPEAAVAAPYTEE